MGDGGHKIRSGKISIEDYDSDEESGEASSEDSSEECEDCEDWSDGSSIPEDRCLYLDTPTTARYNIKVSQSMYWYG